MTAAISLKAITMRGVVALLLSILANVVLLAGVRWTGVVDAFGALTYPPVIFLTIVGVVAATAVYGAITRISLHPDWVFLRVAAVALLISFIPDLIVLQYDPEATLGAVTVLMTMHVVVAVICVLFLTDQYGPQPIGN